MPRRKQAPKRQILPDPLFGSDLLAKFINHIMNDGKKSVAEKIIYDSIDIIAEKTGGAAAAKADNDDGSSGATGIQQRAIEVIKQAISNVQPQAEVKSRRVGGSTYQVPMEVRAERSLTLAMRWLVEAAKKRSSEKTMASRLAAELLDASDNRGTAIKKREDMHRMAEANRAFAHYRW